MNNLVYKYITQIKIKLAMVIKIYHNNKYKISIKKAHIMVNSILKNKLNNFNILVKREALELLLKLMDLLIQIHGVEIKTFLI